MGETHILGETGPHTTLFTDYIGYEAPPDADDILDSDNVLESFSDVVGEYRNMRQAELLTDEVCSEIGTKEARKVRKEFDCYRRMREEVESSVDESTDVRDTHQSLWKRRQKGELLSDWDIPETEPIPDGVPTLQDTPRNDITDAGQIQLSVENGQSRVSDMGNDYHGDNRLFRLTARLLNVYGWGETKAWFDWHWDVEEFIIIQQMNKISDYYDDLPGPNDD